MELHAVYFQRVLLGSSSVQALYGFYILGKITHKILFLTWQKLWHCLLSETMAVWFFLDLHDDMLIEFCNFMLSLVILRTVIHFHSSCSDLNDVCQKGVNKHCGCCFSPDLSRHVKILLLSMALHIIFNWSSFIYIIIEIIGIFPALTNTLF